MEADMASRPDVSRDTAPGRERAVQLRLYREIVFPWRAASALHRSAGNNMKLAFASLFMALLCVGCGGGQDRFEDIVKLRAFGVAGSPVTSAPSTAKAPQTVTLTFYAALPLT